MSIVKKLLASVSAIAMVASSFVAMSVFADNEPTLKATLMTAEELTENYSVAEAGAGVKITFENMEKDTIADMQFTLSIPADLKLEHNAGTAKKPKWVIADISEDTIGEAVLWDDADFQYILNKGTENGFKKYFFIVGGATIPKTSTLMIYFATDEASYTVPTGAFNIGDDVQVVYKGDNSPIKNLKVVQATKSAPTTYTVTCDTVTNGTLSVDKTTAAAGDEVTITATPADNYKLDTLKVEDADGAAVTVTDNKFTMPAKNVTVKATFVEDAPVQSDFEKLGSYTADNSEKDKAVAFVQKLTDMVSSKTYQLYAMVGDKKYNYSKTITLPNITEGAISLGVVIQYNPDEVTADGFNPENVTAFGVTEVE